MVEERGKGDRAGMKSALPMVFLFFSISFLRAQVPANLTDAREVYTLGHRAFAEGLYNTAVEYYTRVEEYIETQPDHKRLFDHHHRDFSMIEIVKEHQRLGRGEPVVNPRILVLYIEEVDTAFRDIPIRTSFSRELKETAKLSQEICKKYMEVMSGGEVTLTFDRLDLTAAVTEIVSYTTYNSEGEELEALDFVLESLQPYPGELFLEHYNDYDVFLFYWDSTDLKIDRYGGPKAFGRAIRLPLIPYVLYGPVRGCVVISSPLLDRPGTLFHEIFHTIEQRYSIAPSHGFWDDNRHHFPGWTGFGEFDYYAYHFDTTLKQAGYNKFEYTASRENTISLDKFSHFQEETISIPISALQEADRLFDEAQPFFHADTAKAKPLLYEAIQLNPYHAGALHRLCVLEHFDGNRELAFDLINRAYKLMPDDTYICYWMGIQYHHKQMPEESIEYFSESLAHDPGYASSWQYRGFINYRLGRYKAALEDFKTCLELTDQFKSWMTDYLTERAGLGEAVAAEMLKELGLY